MTRDTVLSFGKWGPPYRSEDTQNYQGIGSYLTQEAWAVGLPLDETILDSSKTCLQAKFPVCLHNVLVKIFGSDYREKLDPIAKRGKFVTSPVSRPMDVWELYERYLVALENVLGNEFGRLVRSECLNQIELMECTKCPLYVVEVKRLESTIKS